MFLTTQPDSSTLSAGELFWKELQEMPYNLDRIGQCSIHTSWSIPSGDFKDKKSMKNKDPEAEIPIQYDEDDPNRPETEEDAIRAEPLRRLRVDRMFMPRPSPSDKSSLSESKEENMNLPNSEEDPPSTMIENS